jgi:hypothetical protein
MLFFYDLAVYLFDFNIQGGPLVVQDPATKVWTLVGVTSFTVNCKNGGGFAKVNPYINWINMVLNQYGN